MPITPGPWKVSSPSGTHGWEVRTDKPWLESDLICQMSHHPAKQSEAEANARAIALLPQLIATLEDCVGELICEIQERSATPHDPYPEQGNQSVIDALALLKRVTP